MLWLAAAALACWWTATTLTAQHLPTALFGMRDRYNGLATMLTAAGVFAVAVTWGGIHARERVAAERPDAVVDTPEELLGVL